MELFCVPVVLMGRIGKSGIESLRKTPMVKVADQAARHRFGAAATKNLDAMYRVALRMLRNHHEAEDAVQDALNKAWKNLDQFRADAEMKSWLFKILTNTCLDQLRARSRWSQHIDASESEPGDLPSSSPTPDELASDHQQIRSVEHAINALPAQHQVVIQLVVIEQFSYQEAADSLDLPVGTIRSRVSRARAQLIETLNRHADTEKSDPTRLRVVR